MKEIEDTKRYQDKQTGREYRFEWSRFREAVHTAAGREDGISKVEKLLAGAAHVSEAAVHNHLRSRGSPGANFPADIDIIRSYGWVLAGNENAFLRPLMLVEQPSPMTAKELKYQGERTRTDLEYGLRFIGYEDSAQEIILDVFAALWEILSLYVISDGYNCRPDTGGLEGAEDYFDALLRKAQGTASRSETPWNRAHHHIRRLKRILDETEQFVKSYSVPGVSRRWREINPRLNYYDPVFDIVEEFSPDCFRSVQHMFSYHPTQWDIRMRRQYFSVPGEQWGGAAQAYFQEELLDTMTKLFRHDFFELTESEEI